MSFLKSILVDITLSILPYTSNNGYRIIVCKLLEEKSIDEVHVLISLCVIEIYDHWLLT